MGTKKKGNAAPRGASPKGAGKARASKGEADGASAGQALDVEALVQQPPEATAAKMRAYADALRASRASVPRVVAMTSDERRYSPGRIPVSEAPTLRKMLDAIDRNPSVFAVLAPRDHGSDKARVETGPARGALALIEALAPLIAQLEEASQELSDLQLRLGELVRDVTTPAYRIGVANAQLDPRLKADMAAVMNLRGVGKSAKKKKP